MPRQLSHEATRMYPVETLKILTIACMLPTAFAAAGCHPAHPPIVQPGAPGSSSQVIGAATAFA